MNEKLESRLKKLEIEIQENIKKLEQYKIKLSNHIFLARVIVCLACGFALWEYPEYWFVSGPILLFAVIFGGMVEGFFIAKDKAQNDKEK
jgi:hypothetical protein